MIIDLCKPLNEGESLTVRITMSVHEARDALATLRAIGAIGSGGHDLLRGIQDALSRDDRVPDGRAEP